MKPKAIIIGLLIDIGGSSLVGIALGIVVGIIAVARGSTSPDALVDLRANVYLKAIGLVGTTLFTGLGGYVAARMSRPNGLKNAFAVGTLSLILGIVLAMAMPDITPKWKLIAGLLVTLPAAFVGGRLAQPALPNKQRQATRQPARLRRNVRPPRYFMPTEQEINPEGNSYDGQTAVNHFLGKTQEQITKELASRLHWYFYEDFIWMGSRAFCFYFPAVADYVTTAEAKDEDQLVENFCNVIESRLNFDGAEIRESFPAIVRFADYVLTHFGEYGYDPDDEDLRQRLRAIKQQCAEAGAARNDGPAGPQSNSAVPHVPPSTI